MKAAPAGPILCCEEVSREFITERKAIIGTPKKTFLAVSEVSLCIEAGETVGIVGESGSGKSTLGEILGGLRKPTRGTVSFRGIDLKNMDERQYQQYRRNVQFIFQDPKGSMHPQHRIRQIIGEPLITLK
ncbi:MAG: ATP-binding cassette domain-containing protein, partial [Syntrophomonadaceae bacterium]|nr:ATP-binding cassette domain-containing protein [Syntrophomonadaceae bacterium]